MFKTTRNAGLDHGVRTQSLKPTLQTQDGSFVGTFNDGAGNAYMVGHDASGNVRWIVPNFNPQIATADGGLIAQSVDGLATYSCDANGNATGQMASLPVQSWTGLAYQDGPLDQITFLPTSVAANFWPFAHANPSGTPAATPQPWFVPLPSCPGANTPCAQEAVASAVTALRALLNPKPPCCSKFVFDKLQAQGSDINQSKFFDYISRKPRLWDGTRSYAPANVALCAGGWGLCKSAFLQFWYRNCARLPEETTGRHHFANPKR
jgi:hypothetical protein